MSNPLFSALGGSASRPYDDGGFGHMIQQFQNFRNTFNGDPRAEVQRLISTGAMSQAQFNQLGHIANQLMGLMR